MNDQSNLPAVAEKHSLKDVAISDHGLGAHLVPQSMADVVRFADVMSRGAIALPAHLRGDAGACLAVTLQALDWGMNPIAVANKSYSVNNRLAYEAQLIAAVVISRAGIVGRPRYSYTGEPKTTRRCTVTVDVPKRGGEPGELEELTYTSPEVKDIPVKNSPLWRGDEDQQLGYYSVRSLARRHFPELLLGVYDRDEAASMRDVTPRHRETTGLKERLQAQRIEGADKGFSRAAVEEAIDGEFEEAPGHTDLMVEPEVIDAALEAEGEPVPPTEGDHLCREIGEDPRAIAQWISDFKDVCCQAESKQQLISIRADFMESHIRPLYKTAPQRVEELDSWFGDHLKTLPSRKGD